MPEAPGFIRKKLLTATEYLAENAFVAPGYHRLFTAAGLSAGLWGGRQVMDVVTARRSDGSEIKSEEVTPILRPIYAKMRYNPYSDDPQDRWKFVLDRFAPAIAGGFGAWVGSRHFAYGKSLSGKPFHGASAANMEKLEKGEISAQLVDANARRLHSNSTRWLASIGLPVGANSGNQIFGSVMPISASMSANSFQLLNLKKINFMNWGWFNRNVFGNRAAGSASLQPAMVEAARWAETNIVKLGDPKVWLKEEVHAEALNKVVTNALQEFEHVTPEMRARVKDRIELLLSDTHELVQGARAKGVPEKKLYETAYGSVTGTLPSHPYARPEGLLGKSFDRMLHRAEIPLDKMNIGSKDPFSFLSRLIGNNKEELELEQKWAHYLKKEYNLDYGPSRLKADPMHAAIAWGAVGAGAAGACYAGANYSTHLHRRAGRIEDPQDNPETKSKRWIDGKPLDTMQWAARVLIKPPSLHRLMSAAFLSATLMGGMKFANILAGRDLKLVPSKANPESLLAIEKVPELLKPLHGVLSYTPGSKDNHDRWRAAAHYIIPVIFGGYGTYLGSKTYFKDRTKKLEHPTTLEEYSDRILMEQAKPFGALTAITSIFNTGSGLHMIPFANYSSNLNNRYLMGSGQQVAMPVIGKWWSGNPGLTPWGTKGTLDYLSQYLSNNQDARPREVINIVHSLIEKLYPSLSEDQVVSIKQRLINHVYDVRDTYLVDNKIPADKKPELEKSMKKLFSGEGFEDLLQLSGLDPINADLASNGVSGKIANLLGQKKHVLQLEREYVGRLTERRNAKERLDPTEYLQSLVSTSKEMTNQPIKADNDSEKPFTDRIKQDLAPTPVQRN